MKYLLMFALLSCVSAPQFKLEVRRVYSYKFNQCRCQWYNLNSLEAKGGYERCEVFYAREYPNMEILENLEYCEGLQGFSTKAIVERIGPKGNEIIRWANDRCK